MAKNVKSTKRLPFYVIDINVDMSGNLLGSSPSQVGSPLLQNVRFGGVTPRKV
jgi:hypothetical protein